MSIYIKKYFTFVPYVLLTLLLIRACFFYIGPIIDTMEHLQVAWMISDGKIPYLDFFEHHTPLLWYLLAPFTLLMEYNVYIIYAARFISLLSYFLCFLAMYFLIKNHLANKKIAQYSLLGLILLPIWLSLVNLRPDSFMLLCQIMSLYCFYNYLDNRNKKQLIFSYFLSTLSFLFLQKSLIFILCFGLGNIYLLYRKKCKLTDCLIASLYAVLPLFLYLIYLFYSNSLNNFFFYNFIFNIQLNEYLHNASWCRYLFLYVLALLILYIKFCKTNDKQIVLTIIIIGQAFSLYKFAPYTHYYIPYFVLVSVAMGWFIDKIFSKHIFRFYCLYFPLFLISLYVMNNRINKDSYNLSEFIDMSNYLMSDDIKNSTVLNLANGCVFCSQPDFYWFGFDSILTMEYAYNAQRTNPLYLINKHRYKYIYKNMSYPTILKHSEWQAIMNRHLLQSATKSDNPQNYIQYIEPIKTDFWKIDNSVLEKNYIKIKNNSAGEIWKLKE